MRTPLALAVASLLAACVSAPQRIKEDASAAASSESVPKGHPVPPAGEMFPVLLPAPPALTLGSPVDAERLAGLFAEIEVARLRGDAAALHDRYLDEANAAMALAPDAPGTRVGSLPRSASEARLLAALATNDDDEAWKLSKNIQDTDPQYGMVHVGLGLIYERWRIPHQARQAYQRALTTMPGSPFARLGLARLLRAEGDPAAARAALIQVVRELPAYADAHYELGSLLREDSDPVAARGRLETAVTLDPGHFRALRELAEVRVALGSKEGAISAYRQAVAINSGDRALQLALARLLDEKGDERGAALAYEAALDPDKPDPAHLRALVGLYKKLSDTAKETAGLERLVRAEPKDGASHRRLAALRAAKGDEAGAETSWRAAIAANEEDPAAHLGLARLLKTRGKLREALGEYRDAAEKGPPDARAELSSLEKEVNVPRPPLAAKDVNLLYKDAFVLLTRFYKARLLDLPRLRGKLGVKVTVGDDGAAHDAEVVEDTVHDPALEAHLYWSLRDAEYPRGQRDYTFRFELAPVEP